MQGPGGRLQEKGLLFLVLVSVRVLLFCYLLPLTTWLPAVWKNPVLLCPLHFSRPQSPLVSSRLWPQSSEHLSVVLPAWTSCTLGLTLLCWWVSRLPMSQLLSCICLRVLATCAPIECSRLAGPAWYSFLPTSACLHPRKVFSASLVTGAAPVQATH